MRASVLRASMAELEAASFEGAAELAAAADLATELEVEKVRLENELKQSVKQARKREAQQEEQAASQAKIFEEHSASVIQLQRASEEATRGLAAELETLRSDRDGLEAASLRITSAPYPLPTSARLIMDILTRLPRSRSPKKVDGSSG